MNHHHYNAGLVDQGVVSPLLAGTSGSLLILAWLALLADGPYTAHAGIAYGSLNNFDTVNDTSNVCHGFEIELDEIHSADITYTYDYNHYGTPRITEDNSDPVHPKVLVRYEAIWTNTGWSAYTAVPTTNIPPTQGHAFTNPSLNFGGEHFGVGYRTAPGKVLYHWLLDDGSHTLVLGPQVNVSNPMFAYNPPVLAGPPAQVQAVIPAPVLPLPPTSTFEFSDATWVKAILTTSHTNTPVELRNLITPDADNPKAKDWRNGQKAEVEVEWQLLQTDFLSSDYNPTTGIGGPNGKLTTAAQDLSQSDDVVTRRYEYYAYTGPYDDPNGGTHEALAQSVAADGVHGIGIVTNSNGDVFDLSTNAVVGKFLGAQMSAMAAASPLGLIDHLPDGEAGLAYPNRSLVIASDTNFTVGLSGKLPAGLFFDSSSGWIYGTPTDSGVFTVTVTASASNGPVVTKTYPFLVVPAGTQAPPHSTVDINVSPASAGLAVGDGVYTNGSTATVTATANPGYGFAGWTDNGALISTSPTYTFTSVVNRSLIAHFLPQLLICSSPPGGMVIGWPTNFEGYLLQQAFDPGSTNWVAAPEPISIAAEQYQATIQTTNGPRFFRLTHP